MTDHIECGTCGANVNAPGQWLVCRAHYIERVAKLEEDRNELRRIVESLLCCPYSGLTVT